MRYQRTRRGRGVEALHLRFCRTAGYYFGLECWIFACALERQRRQKNDGPSFSIGQWCYCRPLLRDLQCVQSSPQVS